MNKRIEINGKMWPVNFGPATLMNACEQYHDCTIQEFTSALLDDKPKPLRILFAEAIKAGVKMTEGHAPLPQNFGWEMIADWVGYDADKNNELILMAVNSLIPQTDNSSEDDETEEGDSTSEDPEPEKKTWPNLG